MISMLLMMVEWGTDREAGEEFCEALHERQQNESNESNLSRGFRHFVSVHERSNRQSFQLLHVTLNTKTHYNVTHALPF